MRDVECLEKDCDNQVRWKYTSTGNTVYYMCNEHCKIHMDWNYEGKLVMFTGNVPKKFQTSSYGALKPM